MLTRKLAHERLAAFLHDLLDRHCLLGRASHSFRLPMSREDIARFLGLTLESVSRSIGRLQELGLIRARGRQVEIIDPAELTGIAGRH
ncbi:MAG TPA: helix-turn-helix domain-containing protein [Lysobacter sp.]|nr:helix-turn-helix domain-containing protein [Lysobacter sp.]